MLPKICHLRALCDTAQLCEGLVLSAWGYLPWQSAAGYILCSFPPLGALCQHCPSGAEHPCFLLSSLLKNSLLLNLSWLCPCWLSLGTGFRMLPPVIHLVNQELVQNRMFQQEFWACPLLCSFVEGVVARPRLSKEKGPLGWTLTVLVFKCSPTLQSLQQLC